MNTPKSTEVQLHTLCNACEQSSIIHTHLIRRLFKQWISHHCFSLPRCCVSITASCFSPSSPPASTCGSDGGVIGICSSLPSYLVIISEAVIKSEPRRQTLTCSTVAINIWGACDAQSVSELPSRLCFFICPVSLFLFSVELQRLYCSLFYHFASWVIGYSVFGVMAFLGLPAWKL